MKTKSTFCKPGRNQNLPLFSFISRCIVLALLFVGGIAMEGYAQTPTKNLATVDVANTNNRVDDASNANADDENVATLKSSAGTLGFGGLVLGKYNGKLGFEFSTLQDANTTTYVRIRAEEAGLLDALLGGSVGNLVTGLLEGLLLGDHFFKVNVYNGATPLTLSANSKNGFADSRLRLIRNAEGHHLLAITPNEQYDRVVIETQSDAVVTLFAGTKRFYVYNAYTLNGLTDCTPSVSTYYDGTGITVDLLNLGGTGVKDAQNAIDADPNTASEISVGLLGVAASMSQHIVFPTLSTPQHHFTVKLGINSSGVLSADVLGAYEIVAWDGETEVYKHALSGGLLNGVDVLGLLANGTATLTFGPSKAFDRIEIRVNSLVGLNLASSSVEVYDVQRYGPSCPDPSITIPPASENPFEVHSCSGELGLFEHVDFAANATDGNNETYATLNASTGTLLVSGGYSGFIEMKLPEDLNAKRTSYVRIDMEDDILERLVNGSIGQIVSGVGGILLGNHYFEVEATNTGTPVLSSSSANSFASTTGGAVKIVQDNIGRFYIAITPNGTYNTIRITEKVSGLPTGIQKNMKVYDLCYEIGTNKCFAANFTSFDGTGLNLGLLDNGAGVEDADHAISNNSSDYSRISLGTAAVAADVNQTIYFNTPSEVGDQLKVRLQIEPSSLLDLSLLGTYYIKTYLGDDLSETFTLQGGLINGLDLLNLFKSGGVATLNFPTTVKFDRVVVGLNGLVAVGLTPPLRLYNVKRVNADCPETTTESPFESPTCADNLLDASNADDIQNLFDDNFDSYATLNSGAGFLLGLGNKHEGFVELGFDAPVPTDKTTYIRIDYEPTLLNALLGGSLGGALAGLVDNVLLGNHYFSVEVKNGTSSLFTASSNNGFSGNTEKVRIVQDAAGRYYIAVTAGVPYTSIKITDHTDSALGLLAQPNTMNVYGVCFDSPIKECAPIFATSYDGAGITLDVAGLSGVKNANHAIDGNTTNFSEISLGTVAVAGSVKQLFFFNQLGKATDVVDINLATGAGAVNAGVIGNIEIIAYKGAVQVKKLDLQGGIINGVNVLDLLNTGNPTVIPFTPGVEFDRISVGINDLIGANVMPGLRLYSVTKVCDAVVAPEFVSWKSADQTSVSGGEEIEYTIHVRNTGSVDITGLSIEDIIPAHTEYVSGGTLDGNAVIFDGIDVGVGAPTATFTFKVKVNADLTGVTEITNVALVKTDATDPGTETFPPSPTDPNEPDTGATTPGTTIPVDQIKSVVSWKAYTIGASDKTSTAVSGGEEVTYHIYVRNTGNQDLTNVTISDVLPDGVTWKTGGTHAGGAVTFTIPTLAVGATSSAQNFVVTVNKDLTGVTEIKNIAVVQADPNLPGTESFPPVDNTDPKDPDTTTPGTVLDVTANHDVEISKAGISNNVNNGQAQIGNQITYTIAVKNTGNKELSNVTITDELPSTVSIVNNGGGTVSGSTITFDIATLAVDASETFTIIVEVDNLDNAETEIVNKAIVTFRDEGDTADKTEDIEHKMPTSCTPIIATDIDLSTPKTSVCVDEEFTITATTTIGGLVNPVYKWYTNANLTGTPFVGETLTTSLTETTIFYVTVEADGYCFSTPAKEITITVEPDAGTPTITADGGITEVCEGETTTLTATSVGATSYQWFIGGVEISGATAATFAATESGSYTAVALNATGCDSDASAEIEVIVNPLPAQPTITPSTTVDFCEGEFVELTASAAGAYQWYKDGVLLDGFTDQTLSTNEAGDYTVVVFNSTTGCASIPSVATTITVSPAPVLTVTGNQLIYVAKDATITWPNVATDVGAIEWYYEGNALASLPTSLSTPGVYNYTAVSTNGQCYSFETITVNVYDNEGCPPETVRVYANSESWGSIITGGVSNRANAVDGNPKTHSTITTGVGLLGIGTTWQTLYFPNTVKAGTPVTIKLGKEYSGLVLAGGISVVGVKKDGLGTPIDIGLLKPVAGGLLDLLAADNVIEFTFVPSTIAGTKDYDGVRISVGALLSVAQSAKVYGAYITEPGSAGCEPIDNTTNSNVIDVLHGVEDLGLGILSATASVVNPWNAVNNDSASYAQIIRGVAVLNQASLTVVFKQNSMPTDELQIITEVPNNPLLSLELIKGYSIQRYLGNQKVGPQIDADAGVLGLKLLNIAGSDKKKIIVSSYPEPYDRVKIIYGSVVGVLGDMTKIYDVSIKPTIDYGAPIEGNFEICAGDDLVFNAQDVCTFYEVYDAEVDGNRLTPAGGALSFTIPSTTIAGEHKYYVQAIRLGCELGDRQEITVTVNEAPAIQDQPEDIVVAAGTTAEFAVTLVNPSLVVTYQWQEKQSDDTWLDITSTNAESLEIEVPSNTSIGVYGVYRVIVTSDAGCDVVSEEAILNVIHDYGWDDPEAVAKVGDAATATAGEAYSYTVTLINKGTSTINAGTSLYLQDAVSAGQSISGITSSNGTIGALSADGSFTLNVATAVATDESFTLTVSIDVDAAIVADIINNTINIWTEDPAGDYTTPEGTAKTPDIPVERDYGWDHSEAIAKVGDAATATAGEAYSYTVTLTNKGTSTINAGTSLYLQDAVSAGQSISGITSSNGTIGALNADGSFTLNVATAVATDENFTLTVSIDVDAAITADIINNTINIWTEDPAGDYTTPEGTAKTPDIPVERDYGWDDPEAVAKVGDAATATAGESYTYSIYLTNKGSSTILPNTTLYLQDVASAGQTIDGITSNNGTVGAVGTNGEFALTVGTAVDTHETIILTVNVSVASDIVANIINNRINIWSEDPAGDFDTPEGTGVTPDIPVVRVSDFTVVKTTTATEAIAGESVDFKVVLTNSGPSAALVGEKLIITEKPDGLIIAGSDISITSGNATFDGNYDTATGVFTIEVSSEVVVGGTIELNITGHVPANATGTVKNGIEVDGDDDETPPIPVEDKVAFSVVKTTTATTAIAGESVDFKVVLTNNGPSTAKVGRQVIIVEKPDGLIIAGSDITVTSGNATFDGIYDATTGTFTIEVSSEVVVGGTIELSITGHVPANASGTVKNGIEVEGEEDETPPIPVEDKVAFSVVKTTIATTAIAGESVDFKVVITNNGPSTAKVGRKVLIIEKPDGLVIAGSDIAVTSGNATFDGNYNAATGSFTIEVSSEVVVGGTIELKITGHVPADATGTVKNGIDVEGDEDETPEIPVDRTSNLSITKVADEATVKAGESTSFTLTITNNGPSDIASGKEISLSELPSTGVTITGYEVTSGNGTAAGSGNTATVTTSSAVAVGETIIVKVTADIAANAPATTTNGIQVWGPDKPTTETPDDEDETPEIPVDRTSNLSITKVADQATVKAGENTSFTLTITNNGPAEIAIGKNIALAELPSTGLSIMSYDVTSGNGTVIGAGNTATVNTTSAIAVGGTITVKVTAKVAADAPATIANGIQVWGPDKPTTETPDDEDETPEIPVDRTSNLSITKVADEATVKAGESTSFTLTITNNGPSDIASGKVISLSELPSTGVTITGYEVTSGNGTAAGTGNTATVTTSSAVAVGETIIVKVTADIAANAPASITNGIQVWGPDKPTTEKPDDKDETPEIPVDRTSNLSITKVADQKTVVAGEATSFTLTITNNGPSIIAKGKAIRLAELPSAGVTVTGYTVSGNNASVKADAGNVNKATVTTNSAIGIGETIVVKVTANVAANAPATITNGIQVWGPDKPETGTPDDEDETPEIPVNRKYTMGITKVADQNRVKAGENTTFTVTVTNNGPSEIAVGKVINLTERPSTGVTITTYEVTSGNGIAAGTTNRATVTTTKIIPKGATITVKITAAVALDAPENISNGISVWGPDKPTTGPEDDKDDTPEIPVDYPAPNAVDDRAETKSFIEVDIDVLANDTETRFAIDPATLIIVGKPMGGTATVNADGTVTYVSDRGFVGTDTFTYQVKDIEGNWSNEAMVTITVLENPLFFPNTFTPNGDGLNDRFEIKGLDQYTENEIVILNRWGNQVYSKRNYANEWAGENLNEGTYYYILKVKNHAGQWEAHKGAIAIIRVTR